MSGLRERGARRVGGLQMPRRLGKQAAGVAVALCAVLLLLPTPGASAGVYTVGTCQADARYGSSTFTGYVKPGMRTRRACNPGGRGLRGLITANVERRARVPRGAVAVVSFTAPAGTTMTTFDWTGMTKRSDCAYALQIWADVPGTPGFKPIPIENTRANQKCSRSGRLQGSGFRAHSKPVRGATRIIQRVICVGQPGRPSCSARGSNYLATYKASVGIEDNQAPQVSILPKTRLALGEWVGGTQPVYYDASDNVGVQRAVVRIGPAQRGFDDRPCVRAAPEPSDVAAPENRIFAAQVPCPNGMGVVEASTDRYQEGTQQVVVQAWDAAGNATDSAPVTARIDNTPPRRVDVSVDGGSEWHNRNDREVVWSNPAEPDRAPIAGASYKLCAASGGSCSGGGLSGPDLSRLPVTVPGPGEWTLTLWRRDAAGNAEEDNSSVPVTLRYDPEPPQLAFESSAASDPTLVAVRVSDQVSGLADGSIEIRHAASGVWQTLATQKEGSRLLARIDDATLPPGPYVLRARAYDQARNEGLTDLRVDGQPMQVALPLRIAATMDAGFERTRVVTRVVRRHGRRHEVRRRVGVQVPVARFEFGEQARIVGRLAGPDGRGIGGAQVRVVSLTQAGAEQQVGAVQTDADGRFGYVTTGSESRSLVLVYDGSLVILPARGRLEMRVPAATSVRVSRSRVLNGQAVEFTGRLQGLPVPAVGKLIEVQVQLSGSWQTFRTTRSDASGRWASRYRFRRTSGVQRYRFRARLPKEAGYPFETGVSRALVVRVRGQ